MIRTALEWYDQNMHTNYPIVGGANTPDAEVGQAINNMLLPESFIVDLRINTPDLPEADAASRFFLYSVDSMDSMLVLTIAYYSSQGPIICLRSAGIPKSIRNTDNIASRTIELAAASVLDESDPGVMLVQDNTEYAALNKAFGSVVIGTCIDMLNLGTLCFDYAAGAILPACVCKFNDTHTDIGVVDSNNIYHLLGDDVVLQAGDGIDITVDGNQIVITRVPTTAEQTTTITDVKSAIQAIEIQLGEPIYTINGKSPDSKGNFTISGGDCLNVQQGTNSITLSNPCSRPCCSDSQTSTELAANMTQLEAAADRLTAYYDALTTNVSIIQARLASLIASKS